MLRRMASAPSGFRLPRSLVPSIAFIAALGASSCSRAEKPAEPQSTPPSLESAGPSKAASKDLLDQPKTGATDLETQTSALLQASKELDHALALAAPDCGLARTLRDRVCEIADRICGLRDPNPNVQVRCEDGKTRCASAKARVREHCP
jgi:hypothetical protein